MSVKLTINGQYIKDLSFENPNAPAVFLKSSKNSPDISVNVSIGSSKLQSKDEAEKMGFFEVTLHANVKAEIDQLTAFVCEIKYCGIFGVSDFAELAEDELKRTLLINAPGILFPFVREIIARVTSNAGFPPLMLDIIDFEKMYESQSKVNSESDVN